MNPMRGLIDFVLRGKTEHANVVFKTMADERMTTIRDGRRVAVASQMLNQEAKKD
jgi:hypothetical protein